MLPLAPSDTNTQKGKKMDASPYKIRFDILAMAKDLLMEEWSAKRAALESEYHQMVNYQDRIGGHKFVDYPELPPAPSISRIIELANELNSFVSRKS